MYLLEVHLILLSDELTTVSILETTQKIPTLAKFGDSECEDLTFHLASNGKDDKKIHL